MAPSGARKGHPINLAKNLVIDSDCTRVISGRSTFQSIITDLSRTSTSKNGSPPLTDAVGFVVNDEYSTSFVKDPDALTIMTTLYDPHKIWENKSKGGGTETLKNLCITMLGALNPAHFEDLITEKDIQGGFLGRCLLIVEKGRSQINDGLDEDIPKFEIGHLSTRLKEISKVKGRMSLSQEAKEVYRPWYKDWRPEDSDDKTGSGNRLHGHIFKVSTCLSLSRSDDKIISGEDMQTAMNQCHEISRGTTVETIGKGKSKLAGQAGIILRALLDAPENKLSRQQILRKHWTNVDAGSLNEIMDTFMQSGGVIGYLAGGIQYYQLSDKAVEQYAKYEKRKAMG